MVNFYFLNNFQKKKKSVFISMEYVGGFASIGSIFNGICVGELFLSEVFC
jgi:hypothetical protein